MAMIRHDAAWALSPHGMLVRGCVRAYCVFLATNCEHGGLEDCIICPIGVDDALEIPTSLQQQQQR